MPLLQAEPSKAMHFRSNLKLERGRSCRFKRLAWPGLKRNKSKTHFGFCKMGLKIAPFQNLSKMLRFSLTHFWQKIRESNIFTKEIAK